MKKIPSKEWRMISFSEVTKKYGPKIILNKLSFSIKAGEFVVLIGPSGCGKTSTLRMINRLLEANSGQILINGEDIRKADPVQLRRNIGYVIQQIGLFPNMTVEENISLVPRLKKESKERCQEICREMLAMVQMSYDEYAHKYPSQLSGGQQQRIGVLRALAASPPLVLMDEPFGALDPVSRNLLQDEIKKLQKKLKKTIVFVTHDMDEAVRLADTIIFMDKGKIVQQASPEEMLSNPKADIIREFMGRHIQNAQGDRSAIELKDFMRTNVLTVPKNKHVLECVELMSKRDVNTMIALEEDDTFAGIVSINDIKRRGKAGQEIAPILYRPEFLAHLEDSPRMVFDILIDSKDPYIVVLDNEDKVAGIITPTILAKALAQAVWGENE